MGKFKTSWSLFRSSLSVIGKNKKLLLFPVIGFIFIVIIGLFFLSPVLLWDSGHSVTELSHWETLGQHIGKIFENKGFEPFFCRSCNCAGYAFKQWPCHQR